MKKVIFPTLQSIKLLIAQNLHPEALKHSISLPSSSLTDQAYSLFIKSGHGLTPHLATSLITHFSNSGDFRRSSHFLLDLLHPDTLAFTALLSGYARFHRTSSAFALYNTLLISGLRPSEYTLSSLLKSCQQQEHDIVVAHGVCVRFGFSSNPFLVSGLVQKYARCGRLNSAWKCYSECVVLDDVVSTAMINACVLNGDFVISRCVFYGMRRLGLELNEFSITSFLGALWEDVKEGEQIHGVSLKMGLFGGGSVHLSNAMMSMYCRFGSKLDACKVFDEITQPDVVSWTVRIGAALTDAEAFRSFRTMQLNGVEINELTVINVFSVIEDPKMLEPAKQVHSLCHKMGFLMVTSVANALISLYAKCGQMSDAGVVFDEVVSRDVVSWNSLIAGYSQNGLVSSSIETFLVMVGEHYVNPDKYTLASILGALWGSKFSALVRQLHSYIVKAGLNSDESVFSALVSAYGKCNSLDGAKNLLNEVTQMNAGIFHVMASATLDGGSPTDTLILFKLMTSSLLEMEMEMDGVSYSLALKACTALTNLGQARTIHSLALKSGFGSSSFFESALVDVYCKCGNIADAEEAFRNVLIEKNLAACNAMINGYAQHNRHDKVIELFKNMTELGLTPDEITYLGILNSCCHVGRLIEATTHLGSMFELHGVIPCLEHFSCVIDLLGRFGLLEEAKQTIQRMPMSPDAHVWLSLLSSCNLFRDLDLGEFAAQELLKLQPENDSAYVLLLSLYAKSGKWDAVGRLRKEMKEKDICKEPGSSWTEIEGSTFYFLAEDTSHPDADHIYLNLKYLSKQMLPPSGTAQDKFFCYRYVND